MLSSIIEISCPIQVVLASKTHVKAFIMVFEDFSRFL